MAIKPIDSYEEDEPVENDGPSMGSMLKMVFLMVVIFFGAFYWWYSYTYGDEINKRMAQAGIKPTSSISPTPAFDPKTQLNDEAENVLSQLKNSSAGILDSSMKQAADLGGTVMGEATQQIQDTATSSAQAATESVTNLLYENTIGRVILQLFNTLPETAKKAVVEDICEETKECESK